MLKKILSWTAAITVTLLVANHLFVFRQGVVENLVSRITYPFYAVSAGISDYLAGIKLRKRCYTCLKAENERLSARYQELFAQYVKTQCGAHFFESIKELVDFKERYNFSQALIAKVLSRTLTEQEQTLIVNRGSNDGVQAGMIAIFKLQLLGKVVEVYPYYSKVMLLTDRRCKISGFTNTTNAGGIVHGRNDAKECELLYVSHLSTIADEDFVFSSGQGLVFPEGFCLGKIVKHSLEDKALYHRIVIEPLIDLTSLHCCIIAEQSKIALF